MGKRAAQGGGTIRQRPDGRWEARFTVGRDPGTGKQIQKSVYGATQQEVRKKLTQAVTALDNGDYQEPNKMTVGQWLDIWLEDYQGEVKPRTKELYQQQVDYYIRPALGAVGLQNLRTHAIQSFYNSLLKPRGEKKPLSAKSLKNIHGIIHRALQQAVEIGYLKSNPSDACKLPRVQRKPIKPLDEKEIRLFLKAIEGTRYEAIMIVDLFTGLREGEVVGLMWDCIDFENGTICIDKQVQSKKGGGYRIIPPKNGKSRIITPAPTVMAVLRQQRKDQIEKRLRAGALWKDTGFVFTNEIGEHFGPAAVYKSFKKIVSSIGIPEARFHDLRHSFAVLSLQAGDDIKTVQENMGHHTAAFTLDVYGHVTEQMKRESAARMENYIKGVKNL